MHFACNWKLPILKEKMPSLQIRKLPDHIYQALKAQAEQERRSLSQQAVVALARGLDIPFDFRESRKQLMQEIHKQAKRWKKVSGVNIAGWVREDRER